MSFISFTLRLKLTLWFLAIFVVVFSGVVYGAWLLHEEAVRAQTDERLTQLAAGVAAMIEAPESIALEVGLQRLQPVDRTYALLAVRDAEGRILATDGRVDPAALPPPPDRDFAIDFVRDDVARRLVGRAITARMITARVTLPDGTSGSIDLASTSDLIRQGRLYLSDVIVVGVLGSLVASALAAWLVAGRAVQPLKELTKAASQIDLERIAARVDMTDDSAEIESLQRALNEALQRLEEGYRMQGRFIDDVAHELKTPIAVMLTESQVLRPGGASLEDFEEYRQSMIGEMQRLGGLVESFLVLARVDQEDARARHAEVSAIDVLMEAMEECDHEAAYLEVRLIPNVSADESADEMILHGDKDLLRTMLVNLVRNAIRHSPAGECVDIDLANAGDAIIFSVRDRGPGVPEELREVIFDRFVRGVTDRPGVPGTGLGLPIAQRVAALHGGVIEVGTGPGRGSTFTVRIPAADATAETRDPPSSGAA